MNREIRQNWNLRFSIYKAVKFMNHRGKIFNAWKNK
jgi:hypothetical protein